LVPVIALAGNAGSGKSTAARVITQHYQGIEIAQADRLKRFAACQGISTDLLWGDSHLRNEIVPFPAFQDQKWWEWKEHFPIVSDRETVEDLFMETYASFSEQKVPLRKILQVFGTEFAREIDIDVWSRACWDDCRDVLVPHNTYFPTRGVVTKKGARNSLAVITDIRFVSEILFFSSRNVPIVKIERPQNALRAAAGAHASETEMDGMPDHFFDYIIRNTGTLVDLENKVERVVQELLHKTRKY